MTVSNTTSANVAPVIDYTSRDYDGLKSSLLAYAAQAFPEWTPSSEGDFGVLMIELLAYVGDILSYYVDRAQNEAYLTTATQMHSILNIAQLLGYTPSGGVPAQGTVTFITDAKGGAVTVPKGTQLASAYIQAIDGQVVFETTAAVTVPASGGTASVGVVEGQTITDPTTGGPLKIGESDGTPDQQYQFPNPKVYDNTQSVYVNGVQWTIVQYLIDYGPTDTVCSLFTDANGYTWVQFGDGLNGMIPPIGMDISVEYRIGVGSAGNLAAGAIVSFYSSQLQGVSLQQDLTTSAKTTSSATTGGADPETLEQIRANAPAAFRTQQRAVTLQDYINFATNVQGVSAANAVAGFFSSVTVYVVGPGGTAPTTTLLDNVQTALSAVSLEGVSVQTAAPNFIPINFGSNTYPISVTVYPTYSNSVTQTAIQTAIQTHYAVQNSILGQLIQVSDLYHTIMSVNGVRYATVGMMARNDSAQSGTADIQLQAWEFPTVGNIVLSVTGGTA